MRSPWGNPTDSDARAWKDEPFEFEDHWQDDADNEKHDPPRHWEDGDDGGSDA